MCTNHIQVINKRTGRLQYVKCGHCKSCLQEKANKRTARIRNHEQTTGRICLFVTLTYDNKFVPYIRPSEFVPGKPIAVHRDCDIMYKRFGSNYNTLPMAISCDDVYMPCELNTQAKRDFMDSFVNNDNIQFPLLRKYDRQTKKWNYIPDKTGICFYKDFQDFYKRFEIGFKREFGYRPVRSYFCCTEYGETYFRPHFHFLFFCYIWERERIEKHIRKAWPYNGHRRELLDIQIAKNIASYVSQYVNCGSDFPQVLRLFFRPKTVSSQYFGFDNTYFKLSSLLDMFNRNDWSYPCTRMLDGQTFVQRVPLPRYVLNRWFPQIQGYTRLPSNTLFDVAARPFALQCLGKVAHLDFAKQGIATIRLLNAKQRYADQCRRDGRFEKDVVNTLLAKSEFAYLYSRVWWSYISYLQRWSYENYDVNDSWFNYYENIGDLLDYHNFSSDLLDFEIPDGVQIFRHPDNQPWNVRRSLILSELYDKKKKQSKVSNLAMTSRGFNV